MSKGIPKNKIRFAILAIDSVCFRIVNGKLAVLLGTVNVPPFFINRQGLIGGLIAPEETADQAVKRHLKNKAGISRIFFEQLYTFSKVNRDPRGRVVSVAYLALTHQDPRQQKDTLINTDWMPISQLPDLAYDHNEIVKTAIHRLRARIGYTNIAQHLLPDEFTLTDLQNVYEAVLEKDMDKRNFRKKVVAIGLVKRVGKKRYAGTKKPAALYKFSSNQIKIIEVI
jgi:8-oxo-dGTP diphosphatase